MSKGDRRGTGASGGHFALFHSGVCLADIRTMRSEAEMLAHMLGRTREYTLHYLRYLKDVDVHRRFSCEGRELNSVYWLVAHLAVSENGLLLRATGGPFARFSWAKHFTVGSAVLPADQCPPYAEVWETFKAVHAQAMAHLPTLTDAQLQGPNITGLAAIGGTMHDVVTHAIRHEGSHIGHIGWLCKLHGIRTV